MMINKIIDLALERRKEFETFEVYEFPPDENFTTLSWIKGKFAITVEEPKERWLMLPRCINLLEAPGAVRPPAWEYEKLYETPSRIARDYLRLKYRRGAPIKKSQGQMLMEPFTSADLRENFVPTFARPKAFKHGYYVDLKAAYFAIPLRSGWDVNYWPGKHFGRGTPPIDFPFPNHKMARVCLWSVCTVTPIMMHTPNGLVTLHRGNPLINYNLVRLISDTLALIAGYAWDIGCPYAHTDGYICASLEQKESLMGFIHDLGLNANIKDEGPGKVRGRADYDMPHHKSLALKHTMRTSKNIRQLPYAKWLIEHLAWASSRATVTESDLCTPSPV